MSDKITAFPECPTKHSGVALVVGAGPTVFDELTVAIDALPFPPYIIAVNGMGSRVECRALVTAHPELLELYFDGQGLSGKMPAVHYYPSDQRNIPDSVPGVDHIWRGPACASGSSSLAAVMVAKGMGFENVVLCGVPLTKTGYVEDYPKADISEFNVAPKGPTMNGTIQQRLETWSKFHKAGKLAGVTSFSGFTKELLGEPVFEGSI